MTLLRESISEQCASDWHYSTGLRIHTSPIVTRGSLIAESSSFTFVRDINGPFHLNFLTLRYWRFGVYANSSGVAIFEVKSAQNEKRNRSNGGTISMISLTYSIYPDLQRNGRGVGGGGGGGAFASLASRLDHNKKRRDKKEEKNICSIHIFQCVSNRRCQLRKAPIDSWVQKLKDITNGIVVMANSLRAKVIDRRNISLICEVFFCFLALCFCGLGTGRIGGHEPCLVKVSSGSIELFLFPSSYPQLLYTKVVVCTILSLG